MRISKHYLQQIIEHQGLLGLSPVSPLGVLRLAIDLREARERIASLEAEIEEYRRLPRPKPNSDRPGQPGKRLDFKA